VELSLDELFGEIKGTWSEILVVCNAVNEAELEGLRSGESPSKQQQITSSLALKLLSGGCDTKTISFAIFVVDVP